MANNFHSRSIKLSTEIPSDLKAIGSMLKETEALDLSILKSVLASCLGRREHRSKRGGHCFPNLLKPAAYIRNEVEQESGAEDLSFLDICMSRRGIDSIMLKQLKASEKAIQEIEDGLQGSFRSLVKTRVSLLNVLCC